MKLSSSRKQEALVYVVLWAVLFAAPVLGLYIHRLGGTPAAMPWKELLAVWRQLGVFLALFLLHNCVLAPLLVYRQKRLLYFSLVAVLLAGFAIVQCNSRPPGDFGPHPMRQHRGHLPPPEPAHPRPHDRLMHEGQPPVLLGQREVIACIVLVLMLGMNVGVKLYFKQQHDRRRLALLEKENLEQQLEHLRYQINPHFLMNTLNNIHALVDIDPERAKAAIVELSKIMRFVLYEGSKQLVPLRYELDFMQNYITLMRMRYTEKVSISVDIPSQLPDKLVPPLTLITFVENAFKHGVSYRQESFVSVAVSTEQAGRLRFSCKNSKQPQTGHAKGGVGLQNVERRLQLIYGSNYSLSIKDKPDTYNIELEIPL